MAPWIEMTSVDSPRNITTMKVRCMKNSKKAKIINVGLFIYIKKIIRKSGDIRYFLPFFYLIFRTTGKLKCREIRINFFR